jgi:oligosaccharide repeat unit polymerase
MFLLYVFSLLVFVVISIYAKDIWFNPVVFHWLTWSCVFFLNEIPLLNYYQISGKTLIYFYVSSLSFSLGYFFYVFVGIKHNNSLFKKKNEYINHEKLETVIYVIFFISSVLFSYYLISLHKIYGIVNVINSGGTVFRAYQKFGIVPPGFHYFYLMNVNVLISSYFLMSCKIFKKKVLLILIYSLFSLLFTGAKTNFISGISTILFVYSLVNIKKFYIKKFLKSFSIVFSVSILAFLIISGLTKEFGSSSLLDVNNLWLSKLTIASYYITSPIHVFDQITLDKSIQYTYGQYLFLPILKFVSFLGFDYSPPSHIGKFYFTPYPSNIGTYLDVMYKDFGTVGIFAVPFLVGFISNYFFCRQKRNNNFLNCLFLVYIYKLIFASISTSQYVKPVFWFLLICVYFINYIIVEKDRSFRYEI